MTDYDQAARLHLERTLKTAESAGDDEWAEAVRDELKQYENKAAEQEQPPAEVVEESESEVKPSMALTKDELVNLAEQAGLGERDDLEQFTKQELVDELNANEGEG